MAGSGSSFLDFFLSWRARAASAAAACCVGMCDLEMLIKKGVDLEMLINKGVGIVCSIRKLHPRKGEADGRERERDRETEGEKKWEEGKDG